MEFTVKSCALISAVLQNSAHPNNQFKQAVSGRGAARLARLHGVQEVEGSNPFAPTDGKTKTYSIPTNGGYRSYVVLNTTTSRLLYDRE